jgi:hypothetical protein
MKRMTTNLLWALLLVTSATIAAQAQTSDNLGDYARQVRKQKAQAAPAVKKFDNDNLPDNNKVSVIGEAAAPAADANADKDAADGKASDGSASPATPDGATGQPAAKADSAKDAQNEKQKANEAWQKKIQTAQSEIDSQARELDLLNREYRLRAASFYADAGNRLRNSTSWDKEDAQYKDQIATKEKTVEDAKKKLEDLQEEARRAGVPSSMRE